MVMENKFPFRTASEKVVESDDEVVEVIPVREDEEIVVKTEEDENKSTHISVNATPPRRQPPPKPTPSPPGPALYPTRPSG